jgi:Trp operon repressor
MNVLAFLVSRRRRLNREIVAMCVFIDFKRLGAALRCCRNVIFIGRHGMLRVAVGLVLFLTAFLATQEATAQTSDDIARAVRLWLSTHGSVLYRPPLMDNTILVEEGSSRIDDVLKILGIPGRGDTDLRARITAEFLRQEALEKQFGFKFGVGAAITTNRGSNAIKDAVVDSKGIVRVTRQDDTSVGYVLEAHYFFVPERSFLNLTTGNWGIGPFVAIQGGGDQFLSGLGFGLMIGFRQPNSFTNTNLSWNFGIGAIYDPSVKVLGNGLVADRPLPAGDSLRTTEVGSWGLLLVSSFNF